MSEQFGIGDLGLKLANLRMGGALALGADLGGKVYNITQAGEDLNLPAPADMDDLIQNQRSSDLSAIVERIQAGGKTRALDPAELVYAPLVTRPNKIICVGFNYRAHAAETGTPIPKAPPLFAKFSNALNHHNGTVELPTHVDREFDYETELVVIFGEKCRNVSEADALSVVAGYTVGNDVSARGLQNITSQFMAGKMSDGFAPLGPWMATRALVPNPNDLQLKTRVNGDLRQDSSTSEMIFDCRKLIHYVTSIMTVQPGDIMFTGTPPGVIWGQDVPREQRQWLKAGDEVTSSIEGIGDLVVRLV
ncbi:fumarylacetoacetate hydrolase family protein [Burkholderia metallica]|uniref:fumarylacetoacetate hydrolase family protein n=1 Tax=Burkholderia metallica TaxID=488729 RepID=UPI0008418422|nr:fumarylacetoacetate hydrolase family protein [Burkholderia metallica]AOJ33769.1 5-carboxymethyl-2-hydroxymuconate isomerase [Burkholderia metallica]MCA8000374.1 fumarylacetoacetate hydrolase family protein [Burkholderia metallica]